MHTARVVFILFFFNAAFANAFVYRQFTTLNGLSNNNVHEIIEDREGYIWIATDFGLNKLGPNGIDCFYKSNGLLSNTILSLSLDEHGNIWFGTEAGIGAYIDGKFIDFSNEEFACKAVELIITPHFIYTVNQVGELFIYDRTQKMALSFFKNNQKSDEPHVGKITLGNRGEILVASSDGFYELHGREIKKINIPGLPDADFDYVRQDAHGIIWLAAGNTLYRIKEKLIIQSFEIFKNADAKIINVIVDRYNKLWYAGIDNQPVSFLLTDGSRYNINELLGITTLVNNSIIDYSGNIWLSTFGMGVYLFKNEPYKIYDFKQGLSSNYVTDVMPTEHGLLAGTNVSFNYQMNPQGKFYEKKHTDKGSVEYVRNIEKFNNQYLASIYNPQLINEPVLYENIDGHELTFFNCRYIYGDAVNHRVLGDFYQGTIDVFNYSEGRFTFVQSVGTALLLGNEAYLNRIQKINNLYFVCTKKGLLLLDAQLKLQGTYFKGYTVNDVAIESGNLFICGEFGLLSYSVKNKTLHAIKSFSDKPIIPHRMVVDNNHRCWIATSDGVYIISKGAINHLSAEEGLPSNQINNIYFDGLKNEIWLSTNCGIVHIKIQEHPEIFSSARVRFSVEKIIAGDHIYQPHAGVPFQLNQRHFQIQLGYFKYINDHGYWVRYKIDGGPWITTQNAYINVTNIGPGEHHFWVEASDNGYLWTDQLEYRFYITPHWYEKWWFNLLLYVFVALVLVMVIYFIVKRSNRKLKRTIHTNKRIMDLKMQALNAAINSHFIFNVLNAIQYFVSTKQNLKASRFIAEFARLVRIIIDNSNLTAISLDEEIRRIHLYLDLEKMRFEDRINYTIDVDPGIHLNQVFIPNMIIQPFVENCILHGFEGGKGTGEIRISIKKQAEHILILIRDNGIGIRQSMEANKKFNKKSIGSNNALQRLEVYYGKNNFTCSMQDLSNGSETGTLVQLEIPIQSPPITA